MARREIGFLLIGLGVGFLVAVAAVVAPVVWWMRMFIFGFRWSPASLFLTLPFVLIVVGLVLTIRGRRMI